MSCWSSKTLLPYIFDFISVIIEENYVNQEIKAKIQIRNAIKLISYEKNIKAEGDMISKFQVQEFGNPVHSPNR